MPELGKYGSVRGALSNGCLYRDWSKKWGVPKVQESHLSRNRCYVNHQKDSVLRIMHKG
jgi:hypothetical protein